MRSFSTLPDPPDATMLLSPADGAQNLTPPVTLDWQDAAGAASYHVQVSTSQAFTTMARSEAWIRSASAALSESARRRGSMRAW